MQCVSKNPEGVILSTDYGIQLSFADEYKAFLSAYDIEFNPDFLLSD
jgi:hypothetical protein